MQVTRSFFSLDREKAVRLSQTLCVWPGDLNHTGKNVGVVQ